MSHTKSINPLGVPLLEIGRDVNGRFSKNNPGGPGNPFARKVASLRKALLDTVSEEDVKKVGEILKEMAFERDKGAIRLLLQYCVGKPESAKDPDRMDIDEWDRLQQMSVPQEQYDQTKESIPACVACYMTQYSWPCSIQEGDGPVQHAIHYIYEDLNANDQPSKPSPVCVQPDVAPVQPSAPATQTEAPVPKAEGCSSAKEERKSKDRPEQAGQSRRESRSSTQAPLPNGENEPKQETTLEMIRRLYPNYPPSGQPQSKPPKG